MEGVVEVHNVSFKVTYQIGKVCRGLPRPDRFQCDEPCCKPARLLRLRVGSMELFHVVPTGPQQCRFSLGDFVFTARLAVVVVDHQDSHFIPFGMLLPIAACGRLPRNSQRLGNNVLGLPRHHALLSAISAAHGFVLSIADLPKLLVSLFTIKAHS